ncbi:unnamed protein product [Lactuca saligna]|uniref:Uncharacterized protein n=1 Tax=Lactuca saligna TaxID=75948 RepID=A0AA35Y1E1_LACSI|nr:unnamed protein product [Lactuca saligna]
MLNFIKSSSPVLACSRVAELLSSLGIDLNLLFTPLQPYLSCFFLSVLGSRFLSSVSPRFFLSVSDFILVRGQIDETCETSEIAPCSLCGCVRIQRLMAAIGVSKAPYFFSTRQVTQLTLVHLWDQILIMNIESYLSKITSQCVTIQMLGRLAEVGTAVKLSALKPKLEVPPSAACLFWCPLFLVLKDLDLFLVLVPSAACLFKSLDKSCLGPLRKAYCSSLNLLLKHEDQVPENDVKGISKDKPLIHREQEKHKQFLGFLVPYYKPAEYISLLVTYAGNNLVERTYESDINGNKFNTRVHTIRC